MSNTTNDLAGAIGGFIDGLKARNIELERQRDAYAETLRIIAEDQLRGLTHVIHQRHPELAKGATGEKEQEA